MTAAWLALVVALPACAAPATVPESGECAYLADAAIVARAGAIEGVEAGLQQRIHARIYVIQQARVADLIRLIVQQAGQDRRDVAQYAGAIYRACMSGNMDSILGVSS